MKRKNKKQLITSIVLLAVLVIGIGYAYLTSNLSISGTTEIANNSWDIHFENLSVTTGSVTASTPAEIDSNETSIEYAITLSRPKDFYEFTVDVKNDGSVDAMIDTITSKLNNTIITTLPNYLNYNVSYSDGVPIQPNQELNSGAKEKYKIRVEYKKDITESDMPATEQNLSLSFSVTYVQKDSTAVSITHATFNSDSWQTIIDNVKNDNTDHYNVGDTKEVDMGSLGTHTLRIANKSTPDECNQERFSQTACGFVLEFEDSIKRHNVNSTSTNTGGWERSSIRTYINDENDTNSIINSMPDIIKNNIIETQVFSGLRDANNYITTDKMYLLAIHEIMEDVDNDPNTGPDKYDNSYNYTRQLDYYKALNVTTSNYSAAIKLFNNTPQEYWLRSSHAYSPGIFWDIHNDGQYGHAYATSNFLVSPAFRLG